WLGSRRGRGGLLHELPVAKLPRADHSRLPAALARAFALALPRQGRVERLLHERAFARATNARDHAQYAERELDAEVLEVVRARPDQAQAAVGQRAAARPHGDRAPAREERAGHRLLASLDPRGRSLVDDAAALL